MKQFLLMAAFAATVYTGSAQNLQRTAPNQNLLLPTTVGAIELAPASTKKTTEDAQAASWRSVYSAEFINPFLNLNYGGTGSLDVFHYDKITNSLVLERIIPQITGQNITGTQVGYLKSTNLGTTWEGVLGFEEQTLVGSTNISYIENPEATVFEDHALMFTALKYAKVGTNYQDPLLNIWIKNGTTTVNLDLLDAPTNYTFVEGDLCADNLNGIIHFNAALDPKNRPVPVVQRGAYGRFTINMSTTDFGTLGNGIPAPWATTQWGAPQPVALDESFNSPTRVAVDAEGNAYAVFNNFLAGETQKRVVSVSKSLNQGETYSSLNNMPVSAIDAFASFKGRTTTFQGGQTAYKPFELVVRGEDDYSVFIRMSAANSPDGTNLTDITNSIIECRYQNSTWTIIEVADLNSLEIPTFITPDSVSGAPNTTLIASTDNYRGHEIQFATTADGLTEIIKYIDIVPTKIDVLSPGLAFAQRVGNNYAPGDGVIDTLVSTDIFIVTRPKGTTTWSAPINISDDAKYNVRTYMPSVVPSVNQIPMIALAGRTDAQATGWPTATFPSKAKEAKVDYLSEVLFAMLAGTTSVAEENVANYTFRINNIVPNPAIDNAEVVYTLDAPATVSVELFDMLGSKVATIAAPSTQTEGIHGVNVNTSEYASGNYVVALTVNGIRTTKSLVVAR